MTIEFIEFDDGFSIDHALVFILVVPHSHHGWGKTTFSHNWMKGKHNSFLKFSPIFPRINTLKCLSPTHCIVLGKPWEVSFASRRNPIAKVTAMLESLEKKAGKCGVWQEYTVVPQKALTLKVFVGGVYPSSNSGQAHVGSGNINT